MISFYSIKYADLNKLDQIKDKIIFTNDTSQLFVDQGGIRREYCNNISYINTIDELPLAPLNNKLYIVKNTNDVYYYDKSWILLNKSSNNNESEFSYIGKLGIKNPSNEDLDNYVKTMKSRSSKINDFINDISNNQWLKISKSNWVKINPDINISSYEQMGILQIKKNSGLIINDGILSLNLINNEERKPGQIVTLNQKGEIPNDLYKSGTIGWENL